MHLQVVDGSDAGIGGALRAAQAPSAAAISGSGSGRGGLSYPQGRAERLRALTLYWGTGFMLGG